MCYFIFLVGTSQGNCPVIRKCVWIQEDGGFSIQAFLDVHHTLVLEASVVEVKVPASEGEIIWGINPTEH